ncbi:MAG: GTPase [Phycisphaerae bacterium]
MGETRGGVMRRRPGHRLPPIVQGREKRMTCDKTDIRNAPSIRVLTPHGMGAIAVIELRAADAAHIISALTGELKSGIALRSIASDDGVIDEVLIVRRAPNHYELHCHGGVMVVEKLVRRLAQCAGDEELGAKALELWCHPQSDIPPVETLWGLRMLTQARRNSLGRWALEQQSALKTDGSVSIKRAAQWIATASADLHRFLSGEVRMAMIGPPNAGKSSLANFWLGHPMSVTSDIPGTTRDWVEQTVIVAADDIDMAARLTDTAGMRHTEDELERLAIDRGIGALSGVDIILIVMDATHLGTLEHLADEAWGWAESHGVGDQLRSSRWLAVGNKCDRLERMPGAGVGGWNAVWISAIHGTGIADLQRQVLTLLGVPRGLRYPVLSAARLEQLFRITAARDDTEMLSALGRMAADDELLF